MKFLIFALFFCINICGFAENYQERIQSYDKRMEQNLRLAINDRFDDELHFVKNVKKHQRLKRLKLLKQGNKNLPPSRFVYTPFDYFVSEKW